MFNLLLVVGTALCGVLALRAKRLLATALWLASVSVLTSILLYLLGAHEVAVIELSVGAGLVTVLFVFAIAIAGEDAIVAPPVVPKWLSGLVLIVVLGLLGGFLWPFSEQGSNLTSNRSFSAVLWEDRALDMLVQIGLIFAGVMGLLGLLAEEGDKATKWQSDKVIESHLLPSSQRLQPAVHLQSPTAIAHSPEKEAQP